MFFKLRINILGLILLSYTTLLAAEPRNIFQPIEQSQAKSMSEQPILLTRVIKLRYANAKQLAKTIKQHPGLISKGGSVGIDEQSNSLVIYDSARQVQQIRQLVKQLDIPSQQISIQARIMNIDRYYEQSLGVRFGLTQEHSSSGKTTSVHHRGFTVDLPGGIDRVIQTPSAGITLATLGKDVLLDLELSAIEAEGGGKLLSAPHLITSNLVPAYIEAGEEIPYEETTSGGGTAASFKKAVLGLKVVPQIVAGNQVLLDIQVNQDKRGNEIVKGEPAVDTRQ